MKQNIPKKRRICVDCNSKLIKWGETGKGRIQYRCPLCLKTKSSTPRTHRPPTYLVTQPTRGIISICGFKISCFKLHHTFHFPFLIEKNNTFYSTVFGLGIISIFLLTDFIIGHLSFITLLGKERRPLVEVQLLSAAQHNTF